MTMLRTPARSGSNPDPRSIGFKKCIDNQIVMLSIEGRTNEDRPSVVDVYHARHRTSKATVLSITSWDGKHTYTTALSSMHHDWFMYHLGSTIEMHNYDPDAGPGIHYFRSRRTAVCYGGAPHGYSDDCPSYTDDGERIEN